MQDLDEKTTTRRSIVQTGAKLVYAAPIVAATMSLSSSVAGAICTGSVRACQGDPGFSFCNDTEYCSQFARLSCICSTDTEGNYSCSDACNLGQYGCRASSDCPSGQVCKQFCFDYICVSPCVPDHVSGDRKPDLAKSLAVTGDPTLP